LHPQLSADDKFNSYMELTLQLASTQGLIPAVRSSSTKSALANAKAQLQLSLLDEDVGAVLGKKGQTLTQIQQVRVAQPAEYVFHFFAQISQSLAQSCYRYKKQAVVWRKWQEGNALKSSLGGDMQPPCDWGQ
jgi:predicted RNA-binding protein YlqC (UPF0109 family)